MSTSNLFQSELKGLLQEVYIIGQESNSIETNEFIKVIESKLISLFSIINEKEYIHYRE